MARLHKEFIQFNKELKLTTVRRDGLRKSRKDIKRKIRNWFAENKPDELQPNNKTVERLHKYIASGGAVIVSHHAGLTADLKEYKYAATEANHWE